jgi:hypothetical protein
MGRGGPKVCTCLPSKLLFASTAFLQHACRLEEDLEVQKNTTLVVSHITGAARGVRAVSCGAAIWNNRAFLNLNSSL